LKSQIPNQRPKLAPREVNSGRSYYEEQVLSPPTKTIPTPIWQPKHSVLVFLPSEFGNNSKQNSQWGRAFHLKAQTAHTNLGVKTVENFRSLFG
jgi:hypothetical protein